MTHKGGGLGLTHMGSIFNQYYFYFFYHYLNNNGTPFPLFSKCFHHPHMHYMEYLPHMCQMLPYKNHVDRWYQFHNPFTHCFQMQLYDHHHHLLCCEHYFYWCSLLCNKNAHCGFVCNNSSTFWKFTPRWVIRFVLMQHHYKIISLGSFFLNVSYFNCIITYSTTSFVIDIVFKMMIKNSYKDDNFFSKIVTMFLFVMCIYKQANWSMRALILLM